MYPGHQKAHERQRGKFHRFSFGIEVPENSIQSFKKVGYTGTANGRTFNGNMPILVAIATALGLAAFWYYRLRDVGSAAPEVADAAQRIRGACRRKRFRNRAESSPVAAVDDPAAAATAFLISLAASRGSLTPEAEAAIKAQMRDVMAVPNVDGAFVFARCVADHVHDPGDLSLRFSKLWIAHLQPEERADLYDMASRIAALDGDPTDLQIGCLRALHVRLGLTRP